MALPDEINKQLQTNALITVYKLLNFNDPPCDKDLCF